MLMFHSSNSLRCNQIGVVKITPAHDKLDFAIGASHNLPKLDVITGDGFLNDLAGNYKVLNSNHRMLRCTLMQTF